MTLTLPLPPPWLQERYPELSKDAQGNPIVQPLEASNLMFYTTIATSGSGRAVVIATGDKTVMGQIAGLAMETGAVRTERYGTAGGVG